MKLRCAAALLAVTGLALAGCGTTAPSNTTTSGAAAASTPAPNSTGRIVFRRYTDNTGQTGALIVSNPDGSAELTLTKPDPGTVDGEPNWAPDGSRVVFTRFAAIGTNSETNRLFTVAADGSGLMQLTNGAAAAGPLIDIDDKAAYSPDGKLIAYNHEGGDGHDGQLQHVNIWIMNADGSDPHSVTQLPAYSGDACCAAWSPDGSRLVYSFSDASTKKTALFLINVDGTGTKQLTDWSLGAGGAPDWSAANVIAFRTALVEETGIGNISTINPDGTGLTQVTHLKDAVISHKVSFSPDGKWIVFAQSSTGTNLIYTMRADGTDQHLVKRSSTEEAAPDWGPRSAG